MQNPSFYRSYISQIASLLLWVALASSLSANVSLPPTQSEIGFVARLLINEAPFPGEKGYVSEENSKATMDAVLAVVVNRAYNVPPPYTRKAVASVDSSDLMAIITAGGERGQVDGFYKDSSGHLQTVPRVEERIQYLLGIANKGTPGTFARLFEHAVIRAQLALTRENAIPDPFANLSRIEDIPVTGYGFAWMTDHLQFNPGGNFLRIPNPSGGSLGGNRFFTLRKKPL